MLSVARRAAGDGARLALTLGVINQHFAILQVEGSSNDSATHRSIAAPLGGFVSVWAEIVARMECSEIRGSSSRDLLRFFRTTFLAWHA